MREVDSFSGVEKAHVVDRHGEDLRSAGKVNCIHGDLCTFPFRIIFVDLYDTIGSIAVVDLERNIACNLDQTAADAPQERLIRIVRSDVNYATADGRAICIIGNDRTLHGSGGIELAHVSKEPVQAKRKTASASGTTATSIAGVLIDGMEDVSQRLGCD